VDTSAVTASAHLRRYAAFSPVSKAEYRATMAEEGELLRAHGYALAPPMPFEAVAVWIDAGMPPVDDVEEPMRPLVVAFEAAIEAAWSWREEAVGGALTVDAILAGQEAEGLPLGRWVETVLGALRRDDETLEILALRVRVRILLALAHETLSAGEELADAAGLREAMRARATAEA
jgi:hypothetical protein